MFFLKSHNKQGMLVLFACDLSTQEAESGASLDIPGESELQEWASDESGLQYKTMSCGGSEWM